MHTTETYTDQTVYEDKNLFLSEQKLDSFSEVFIALSKKEAPRELSFEENQAYQQIYTYFFPKLSSYVKNRFSIEDLSIHQQTADHLAQKTLQSFWKRLVNGKEFTTLHISSYLYTTCRNKAINFNRDKGRRREFFADPDLFSVFASIDCVEDDYDNRESMIEVNQILKYALNEVKKLNHSYYQALIGKYILDLSEQELKDFMNKKSVNAAKAALHRARGKLREIILETSQDLSNSHGMMLIISRSNFDIKQFEQEDN